MSEHNHEDTGSLMSEGEFQQPYVEDDYSIASESTVKSEKLMPARKKQRNYMDAYKLNDKSYHKLYRPGGDKNDKVGVYSTNSTPGSLIRDAVTGATHYLHCVGSHYEDLYFKTGFATGEFGSETKTMFFDSPEQYERHLNATVSQRNKTTWTNKFAAARDLLHGE